MLCLLWNVTIVMLVRYVSTVSYVWYGMLAWYVMVRQDMIA